MTILTLKRKNYQICKQVKYHQQMRYMQSHSSSYTANSTKKLLRLVEKTTRILNKPHTKHLRLLSTRKIYNHFVFLQRKIKIHKKTNALTNVQKAVKNGKGNPSKRAFLTAVADKKVFALNVKIKNLPSKNLSTNPRNANTDTKGIPVPKKINSYPESNRSVTPFFGVKDCPVILLSARVTHAPTAPCPIPQNFLKKNAKAAYSFLYKINPFIIAAKQTNNLYREYKDPFKDATFKFFVSEPDKDFQTHLAKEKVMTNISEAGSNTAALNDHLS